MWLQRPMVAVWLIFLTVDARQLLTSRSPVIGIPNKVQDVQTLCNSTSMDIAVVMERPFKGLLAAKDFSQECGSVGTLHNTINLTIPPSGCGVRMTANSSDGRMFYSVNLIAQQDRYLRQVTDQEIVVRCWLKENALTLKSEPMVTALKNYAATDESGENRVGRMRPGWKGKGQKGTVEVTSELNKEIEDMLSSARAWMEISPADNKITSDFVQVGEPTLLSVKTTLPAGIGWRVIECSAHDGTGDSSQRLLDDLGCPIDESILPALTFKKAKIVGQKPHITMRHQEAIASFSAFKFPDRDRLHISCGLQLCRGLCIDADCRARNDSIRRFPRKLQKGEKGEILDRLEVFNSVEVLAPGIELDTTDIISDGKTSVLTSIPGDRTFCVSPNKMALSFCVLGIILLIAIVVALWSLLRARRSSHTQPYYTRSLFSSSGSSGSRYGGSKLLLNASPCLGQTRHWRIL